LEKVVGTKAAAARERELKRMARETKLALAERFCE
jgi:predicted GIY-YIG superfamily endonuclease